MLGGLFSQLQPYAIWYTAYTLLAKLAVVAAQSSLGPEAGHAQLVVVCLIKWLSVLLILWRPPFTKVSIHHSARFQPRAA